MNSNLQNKLSAFEVPPPKDTWDKIADSLDTGQNFAQRLYDYEERPKENRWKTIEANLQEPSPARVVPIPRKRWQYIGAAACVFLIVAIGTLLLMNNTSPSSSTSGEVAAPIKRLSDNKAATVDVPSTNTSSTAASLTGAEESKSSKQRITIASVRPQIIAAASALQVKLTPRPVAPKQLFNFSQLNDHIIYTNDEGHTMKLSKKLFDWVHCKDGDESCKERIRQLQQKLSSNITTGDFTCILEMLQQLQ